MSIAPLSPHDACTHTTLTHATQAYIKEQKWLDAVFDKYDTNKSGQLEKGQLIELLRRVLTLNLTLTHTLALALTLTLTLTSPPHHLTTSPSPST